MGFKRNLDQEFISALNHLYDQPNSWWRKLVDSKDVFFAIRNNYINAYSSGMSIGKITREKDVIRLLVNEEYLTLKNQEPYVDLLSSGPADIDRTRPIAANEKDYIFNLPRIKNRAGRFAGDERKGTNKVACCILTVLDMEAAFEDKKDQDPDPENEEEVLTKKGRMDLIVLTPNLKVITIEAKLYANKDLRSEVTPKVCGQLAEYHQFLSKHQHQSQLKEAYQNVVSIFGKLRGNFFKKRTGHTNWRNAQNDPNTISIDPIPRLLIFGFDELQKKGVKKDAAQIQKLVSFSGFSPKSVIHIGKTTSIKETHLA